MSNITACPHCGAPFPGASVAGDYRCKFCGNKIRLDKNSISDGKADTEFYQPDPPQSLETYQETAKKSDSPAVGKPNPIPQEVIDGLNNTRTFMDRARKWTIWIILGIIAFCALCVLSLVFIFRMGI